MIHVTTETTECYGNGLELLNNLTNAIRAIAGELMGAGLSESITRDIMGKAVEFGMKAAKEELAEKEDSKNG